MKPIKHKHCNCEVGPDYENTVHCYADGKEFVTCWKLTPFERIRVLLTGTVWAAVDGKRYMPGLSLTVRPMIQVDRTAILKSLAEEDDD